MQHTFEMERLKHEALMHLVLGGVIPGRMGKKFMGVLRRQ